MATGVLNYRPDHVLDIEGLRRDGPRVMLDAALIAIHDEAGRACRDHSHHTRGGPQYRRVIGQSLHVAYWQKRTVSLYDRESPRSMGLSYVIHYGLLLNWSPLRCLRQNSPSMKLLTFGSVIGAGSISITLPPTTESMQGESVKS
jgi:hypothetical protein